jgi:hypothetical protein
VKFTGQIRVPEVDHPGVPATFLIDGVQAEVVLEGESLGRWSLYDVHARRLVSSAFQVELGGEEVTFLADDPIDFAYRGVEHMAEVWARFKSMNVARRPVAVRRSRKGTTPSKVSELRNAMVENLQAERSGFLTDNEPVRQDEITAKSVAQKMESLSVKDKSIESVEPATETRIPIIGETTGDEGDHLEAQRAEAERAEQQLLESERLEDEKRSIEEERARLEAEKLSLEAERLKAEQMEADRIEAFRLEMKRLESEREDQQRLEAEQSEASRQEMERLQAERAEMERLETERKERERHESERLEAARAEAQQLEQQRVEMDRLEAERAKSARKELAGIEKKRKEIERLEVERAEQERSDTDRREAIQAEMERLEAQRAEDLRLEAQRVSQERLEAKKLEQERARAEQAAAEQTAAALEQERLDSEEAPDEGAVEETPPAIVKELLSTSGGSDDSEVSKQLVVDLGEFEAPGTEPDSDSQPEPALAGVPREKPGIMGAVKSAFSRSGRNHVHELVEAPGGIGIGRSICEECGYVSISSSD